MNYFLAISASLAYWIPFVILLDIVFYVIQIPFAMIHRYAVYAVMLIKLFLQCSFFSYLAINISYYSQIHIIPFYIVFIVVLYFQQLKYFRNADNQNNMELGKICCYAFIPFFVLSEWVTPSFLQTAYLQYVYFFEYLQASPGIGSALRYLFYIVGAAYFIYTIVRIIIYFSTRKHLTS